MVERDKVACIVGEISSASGLTISQVADRTKTLFVNTGCNSDELRGRGCNQFMAHVESAKFHVCEDGAAARCSPTTW